MIYHLSMLIIVDTEEVKNQLNSSESIYKLF